jgi:hypothetical protein
MIPKSVKRFSGKIMRKRMNHVRVRATPVRLSQS